MFTGLVEELGSVRQIERGARSARLVISARQVNEGTAIGHSIAVNGACLTVVHLDAQGFTAEVMAETLDRTNLGELRPGDRVNLERAMALGDRLGGHLVSGHVDGVGTIVRQERIDIALVTTIAAPLEILRYTVVKGSVTVDGVSLTVIEVLPDTVSVSLIPHTAAHTTLGTKRQGDRVNLEADLLARYLERLLAGKEQGHQPARRLGLTLESLADNGFV